MKNKNIPSRTSKARKLEYKRRKKCLMNQGKCCRCKKKKEAIEMRVCNSCAEKERLNSRKKQGFSGKIGRPLLYRERRNGQNE